MNIRTLHAVTIGLTALLLALPAEAPAQGRHPEGGERSVQKLQRERKAPRPNAVRLQGEVQHSRRGFTLGGQDLVFTSRTSFFPGVSDRSRALEPSSLRNRTATVYGRRTPRGVEVALMILTGEDPAVDTRLDLDSLLDEPRPDPEQFQIPSDEHPDFGVLTEDAPS
jgi:hypothetical protein